MYKSKNQMKRALLILFIAVISLPSFAQDKETRYVNNFEAIKVSHGIEVVLVDGPEGEIIVKTHHIDQDEIETYVDRGVLRIKYRSSSMWDWDERYNRRDVIVEVPVHKLYRIEVNTGALVRSEIVISGDDFDIEATTGGELELEISVDRLDADISMGAVVEVKGIARIIRVKASMGAEVDLRRVETEIVTAKANMGAMLKVFAKKEADITSNMGGMVRIYGDPERRYVSHSFGGEIDFEPYN